MADSAHLIHTARLRALQAYLDARQLEALVVSAPLNIAYLSGFAGSAGLLLVTREGRFLLVDGRYEVQARESVAAGKLGPVTIERVDGRYDQALASVVAREGIRHVGLEAGHVTMATMSAWQRAVIGVEWEPTERVVEAQRLIKDASEIEIFRRAARTLNEMASRLGTIVARGKTEQDVASGIDRAIVEAGFQRPAFPTIVASGPNSAHPHARPTEPTPRGGRPGRAGLWRGIRRILRRFDADGRGWIARPRRPWRSSRRVREAQRRGRRVRCVREFRRLTSTRPRAPCSRLEGPR